MAVEHAVEGLAVGIEQELGWIAPEPGLRVERPVDPEPVPLPRSYGRQVHVPHVAVDLVEPDAGLGAVARDQAQVHRLGDLGEQ